MAKGKGATAAAAAAVAEASSSVPPNVAHGVRVTLAFFVLYYAFLFAQGTLKRKLRAYYAAQDKKVRGSVCSCCCVDVLMLSSQLRSTKRGICAKIGLTQHCTACMQHLNTEHYDMATVPSRSKLA